MVNKIRPDYVNPLTMMKNHKQKNPLDLVPGKAEEKKQKALEAEKQSIQNSLLLLKGASGNGETPEEDIKILEKKLEEVTNAIQTSKRENPEQAAAEEGLAFPAKSGQMRRDLVQLSSQAKREASIGYRAAGTDSNCGIDEFAKEKLMEDYSRLQGGYLSDAVFGMLDLESARDVYDECMANGMSKEEAGKKYNERLEERFGHFKEALALALEFVPMDEDATGEPVSYSDVYDENGRLKVPVKLTFEEYYKNLQSILENMTDALKTRKNEYPGLYKIYFGE